MSRSLAVALVAGISAVLPAPLAAQQAASEPAPVTAEQAIENARTQWSVLREEPKPDPCADANADADTIVVCRQTEDGSRYTFERPTRADTEVAGDGSPRAQDPGGMLPPCSAYTVCVGKLGHVPPPAIMIDFDLLPETPAGSEAARRYGGPTDADEAPQAPAPAARQAEDSVDPSLEILRGLDDDVYGP